MLGAIRRFFIRSRPAALGLRRRILLIITLGSIALSLFLAFTTFGLTRSNLVDERDEAAINTSRSNALTVDQDLRRLFPLEPTVARESLRVSGTERYTLFYRNQFWYDEAPYTSDTIPQALFDAVVEDGQSSRQIVRIGDELNIVVGWLLPDVGAYFEFFPIEDIDSNLSNLRVALVLAAVITTGLGVLVGVFAARRAVRPLGTAAQAASAIAGGRLDTRLENTDDPDLRVLTESFNDMAEALEQRVERDARFASDVSHELRSPLMTLAASVEVMEARRDDMPERAVSALDLLSSDVVRFQGLVEDLLEISRFDAGAIRLNTDELLAAEFVRQAVAVSADPETPIEVSPAAEMSIIVGDKRRLARVVANLIDNALAYGGGSCEIMIDFDNDMLTIAVQDHGLGVAEEERSLIFERFARGGLAGRRTGSEGAGLGLSLVDEHVRMHGGRVWVEDRLDGESGARFVIELPATELDE